MRARLPWILFAISLVLNICVVAGFLYYRSTESDWRGSGSGTSAVFAASKLKLEPAQKAKFEAMRQTLRANQQANSTVARPLRRELRQELNAAQPDFAKIDKLIDAISAQQANAYKAAAHAISDFQNALNAEQRVEFNRLIRERVAARMMYGPDRQGEQRTRGGERDRDAPVTK